MDLKDIVILLLIICIFGTLIFGSLGSFFYHVGEFMGHASNGAGATTDKFSVEYLEGKSPDSPSRNSQPNDVNNQKDYSVVDGSDSSKSSSSQNNVASSESSQGESKSFEKYLGISNASSKGSDSSGGSSGGSGSSNVSSGASGGSSNASSNPLGSISNGLSNGFKSVGEILGIHNDNPTSSGGSGSSKGENNIHPHNISKNTSSITNNTINNTVINHTDINYTDVNHTDVNKTTKYVDYQINYTTNMFDSQNNPIIRSIVSTSGGMVEPGIYEVYWSKLGVINQTRIG